MTLGTTRQHGAARGRGEGDSPYFDLITIFVWDLIASNSFLRRVGVEGSTRNSGGGGPAAVQGGGAVVDSGACTGARRLDYDAHVSPLKIRYTQGFEARSCEGI